MKAELSNALFDALPKTGWLYPDLTLSAAQMYGQGVRADDLHALVERGLAESKVLCRCARCPACQTHQCSIWERCMRCESANLTAIPLFHHILCAAIFEAPNGLAAVERCEKCDQPLADEPAMVEPVGDTYRCRDCGGHSPEPKLAFYCFGCQKVHAFDEVTFHRLWKFRRATTHSTLTDSVRQKNDV